MEFDHVTLLATLNSEAAPAFLDNLWTPDIQQ
jgi:hypothetical protein